MPFDNSTAPFGPDWLRQRQHEWEALRSDDLRAHADYWSGRIAAERERLAQAGFECEAASAQERVARYRRYFEAADGSTSRGDA